VAGAAAANDQWASAFQGWGLLKPSSEPLIIDGNVFPFIWREHWVIAVPQETPTEIMNKLENMAISVVTLPAQIPTEPLPRLTELLGGAE
jgi:hypothetical protein